MPSLEQRLRKSILDLDGVMAGDSVFDVGLEAFFVDGRQMAGILDGAVHIRLTWPVIREHRALLRGDERVTIPRSGTDWISVAFRSGKDIPFIFELVELAAVQHRPAAGRALRPPPTGADLERRRRWH